jgi:hypothetical protein
LGWRERELLTGGWIGDSQFVAFVKYYLGDQITEDEVRITCSMHRVETKEHIILISKALGGGDLGSRKLRWRSISRMVKK